MTPIPDFFEALTGYRAWGALPNGLLTGLHQMEPWPPCEPFVARCAGSVGANAHHLYAQQQHLDEFGTWRPAPQFGCSCGIYAQASPALAIEELQERVYQEMNGDLHMVDTPEEIHCRLVAVWGEVKLWGRVVLHDRGFRAERAYPGAELTCTRNAPPGLEERIAQVYGVPCRRDVERTIVLNATEYVERPPATRWGPFDQYHAALKVANQLRDTLNVNLPSFLMPLGFNGIVTVQPGALHPYPAPSTGKQLRDAARRLLGRI